MKATLTPSDGSAVIDLTTARDVYILKRPNGNYRLHRSSIWAPAERATHMPAGRFFFQSDTGAVLADLVIPGIWWGSDIVLRSAPLQIKRTVAELVAKTFMFNFGDTGTPSKSIAIRPIAAAGSTFKGPMDWAWVERDMPQTGERGDIGIITDASAQFMLGGSPIPMLAAAQAAASIPNHFRDENTGKLINLISYPSANAYDLPGLQGGPFLIKGEPNPQAPQYSQYGGDWQPQQAHYPELCYIGYMTTLDVDFLYDLQNAANFGVLSNAYLSNQRGIATIDGERRGRAWEKRNLFMAHVATKDYETYCAANGIPFPADLLPSSYWKQLLDQTLAYYAPMMADPVAKTFGLVPPDGRYSPWMQDYECLSNLFGVLTGHSEWAEYCLFNLKNVIDRTSGKSGWPPGTGTTYRQNLYPGGDGTKPVFTWRQSFDDLLNDDEARISQADHDKLIANPLNGGVALLSAGKGAYNITTRGVLVAADYLDRKGLLGVRARFPEFDAALTNSVTMFLNDGVTNARVSIVADGAPITIPDPAPEDPPETPPTGEPPMKTFAELSADVHAQSNVIDSAVSVLATIVARLKAMAEAAAGNSINPADVDALAQEIEAHTASLGGAIANVPAE